MDSSYFSQLAKAIHETGIAHPVLVIDKERLDKNSSCLANVKSQNKAVRLVAKSLPSVPVLRHLMQRLETTRLMCFHLPFLMHLTEEIPEADILIGKPMPQRAVESFYQWQSQKDTTFEPEQQLQWLVDCEERLSDYEALARRLGLRLRINLEVDIGLHRGGFANLEAFERSLRLLKQSHHLCFSGIMGYEAHITKIPWYLGGPQRAERQAKSSYATFVSVIETVFGDPQQYCLNAGGSTTYPLYTSQDLCNEIACASALVKPSDFDVYTLQSHLPAAFIATPVLKTISRPELPMAQGLSRLLRITGLLHHQAVFIYGGNWLARPCFPEGMRKVRYFGASSNQEMYSLKEGTPLKSDHWVFFRPTQSEAVMLQFGKIAIFENGRIVDWWQSFEYPDTLYPLASHSD